MESGSELSKTVAIFVVQKILLDETGLVSSVIMWHQQMLIVYSIIFVKRMRDFMQ